MSESININDMSKFKNQIDSLFEDSKNNTGFEDKMPYSIGIFLDKVSRGEATKELEEDIAFAKKLFPEDIICN